MLKIMIMMMTITIMKILTKIAKIDKTDDNMVVKYILQKERIKISLSR